jgi:hypothetical protein
MIFSDRLGPTESDAKCQLASYARASSIKRQLGDGTPSSGLGQMSLMLIVVASLILLVLVSFGVEALRRRPSTP